MNKNPLLMQSIDTISVVTPKRKAFFTRLFGGGLCIDVLAHLPNNVQKRIDTNHVSPALHGCLITCVFHVIAHHPSPRKGSPYRIHGMIDSTQTPCELLFFNAAPHFLKRVAPEGETICVSGKLTYARLHGSDRYQISHPDHMGPINSKSAWCGIERIYPLTAGLTQGLVVSAVDHVLSTLCDQDEWISADICAHFNFPTWKDACLQVHAPQSVLDLSPISRARKRLAYDELFAKQLAMYFFKKQHTEARAHAIPVINPDGFAQKLLHQLPFTLTSDQLRAYHDVLTDLSRETPMHRLLQGDVGSGKTIVALLSALCVIDQGYQAALLAPTDILVRQHARTIQRMLGDLPVRVAVLTGREKGKTRDKILHDLATHQIDLIIGTHALIQPDVIYARLGISLIDEQHRFGVKQRLELTQKAAHTHVLSMTATPIPRTLLLANYGEMDVSLLKEKPPGRKEIETRTISLDRLNDVISFVGHVIARNEKVFWVCPLVDESEKLDVAAATQRFEDLFNQFGDCVVLTHGQLKAADKEAAMDRFAHHDARILVSTTVIEVGVDVPDATVMIIEHAERFGLAQLHQLRGRIGRGQLNGHCLLLYGNPLSFVAQKRLQMMKQTNDGFELADADLRLRGGGDTLGLKQSGLPDFRFACFDGESDEHDDVYACMQLMYDYADNDAKTLLAADPDLTSARGQAARFVLELFNLNHADQLKRAG